MVFLLLLRKPPTLVLLTSHSQAIVGPLVHSIDKSATGPQPKREEAWEVSYLLATSSSPLPVPVTKETNRSTIHHRLDLDVRISCFKVQCQLVSTTEIHGGGPAQL